MQLNVAGAPVYAYTGSRPLLPELPALLLVHGAGNDHSVWALQSRYLAHHGRNVLAVDLPGHGRSGGAPLTSVEAIAAWLPAVMDAAGIGQAALVGHSMGALAALECAAASPRRITRLALLGPAVPMGVNDALLDAARADDHVALELITGWAHGAARQLGSNPWPGVWMTGNALRLLERSASQVLATDLEACARYTHGLEAATRVRCPVLCVLGESDLMAPPPGAAALLDRLPSPDVVRLPRCGHAMMSEAPDAVLDALRAFL
jgi:pimeloyl-ACP methyl ester carboxylesterase